MIIKQIQIKITMIVASKQSITEQPNIQAASLSILFKNQSADKPVNIQLPSSQTSRLLASQTI